MSENALLNNSILFRNIKHPRPFGASQPTLYHFPPLDKIPEKEQGLNLKILSFLLDEFGNSSDNRIYFRNTKQGVTQHQIRKKPCLWLMPSDVLCSVCAVYPLFYFRYISVLLLQLDELCCLFELFDLHFLNGVTRDALNLCDSPRKEKEKDANDKQQQSHNHQRHSWPHPNPIEYEFTLSELSQRFSDLLGHSPALSSFTHCFIAVLSDETTTW